MSKREGDPIPCLVPHCRGRSWKWAAGNEYLCARHYRLVDPAWRALHNKTRREYTNATRQGCEATEVIRRGVRIWDRIRTQALARAMGEPEAIEEADERPQGRIVRATRHKPDF